MKNVRIATFIYIFSLVAISACGGSSNTDSSSSSNNSNQSSSSQAVDYTIETSVTGSGTLTPSQAMAQNGESLSLEALPSEGHTLEEISGCEGSYNEGTFFIEAVTESCTVTAVFEPIAISVNVNTSGNGQYHASQEALAYGDSLTLETTPDEGYYLESATGCSGEADESIYTVDKLVSDCSIDLVFAELPPLPESPQIWFDYQQEKTIRFYWDPVQGADELQLLERLSENDTYDIVASPEVGTQTYDHRVLLLTHTNASYKLRACNIAGCSESNTAFTSNNILEVAGSWQRNIEEIDPLAITLDETGKTMLISTQSPDTDHVFMYTAHVYAKEGEQWLYRQELTGSARNNVDQDAFGQNIAVATEGKVIAVGAPLHADTVPDENGSQQSSDDIYPGAVYIYRYTNGIWEEEAYINPADPNGNIFFGSKVGISKDGNTLAILSRADQTLSDGSSTAGAIHLYKYENGVWENTDTLTPSCGVQIETILSGELDVADNGNIIALGATVSFETSLGPIPEDFFENLLANPCHRGFVYIFQNHDGSWQEKRVKPDDGQLEFGNNFSISDDGTTFSSAGLRPNNLYIYENISGTWKSVFMQEGETKSVIDPTGTKLVIIENFQQSNSKKQAASLYIKKESEWSPLASNIILNDAELDSLFMLEFSEHGEALHIGNEIYDEDTFIIRTY